MTPRIPRSRGRRTAGGTLLAAALLLGASAPAAGPVWTPVGPMPSRRGQVENIQDGEVVGAVNAVTPHPTDPDVVYVGAVNGGVWKTTNARAASPSWTNLTDDQGSLSVGALEFDPTDASGKTLVAGSGRFSSLSGEGGARAGLLRTTNGGATWAAVNAKGAIAGLNVSGVAPRGATIVVASNAADDPAKVGLYRTTNAGAAWVRVSGAAGTGLPAGTIFDLAGAPDAPRRLYATAGTTGLYRSDDAGATWRRVSSAAMNALIAVSGNVRIAAGPGGVVYAAVVRASTSQLSGVFRSADGGATWSGLGLPATAEGGIHPGQQGVTHLALAADLGNPNLVYIGGDRQDGNFDTGHTTANSIGARDYSGILFRGDASKLPGNPWAHITHAGLAAVPGSGTAHGSAPHADSRDMDVAADGTLVLGCDGGVYRRTSPRTAAGDWFSMNGNLQATEFHSVAYDANAHVVIGGAQDTGTPEEPGRAGLKWDSVSTGDGGVVAVDDTSTPGLSTRYSSYYDLGNFRRRVYDAGGVFQSEVSPALSVIDGDPPEFQFYTPLRLNTVAPTRLIIGAANGVYESLDQGDTVAEIGTDIQVNGSGPNPIAYGAKGNPDVLYVGSGSRVFVRTAAPPATLDPSDNYPGGFVRGVAVDPDRPDAAFVVDRARVYRTTDAGAGWNDVTGNLGALAPGTLRSVAYSTHAPGGVLVVGGDTGVFAAPGPAFNAWSRLGSGLPRVPVFHVEHDPADKILLVGTLGRGAWTLKLAPASPGAAPPVAAGTPAPAAPTTPAAPPAVTPAPQAPHP